MAFSRIAYDFISFGERVNNTMSCHPGPGPGSKSSTYWVYASGLKPECALTLTKIRFLRWLVIYEEFSSIFEGGEISNSLILFNNVL